MSTVITVYLQYTDFGFPLASALEVAGVALTLCLVLYYSLFSKEAIPYIRFSPKLI